MIQAVCLLFVSKICSTILGVFDFLYEIPLISTVWGFVDGLVDGIVGIFVLVFCVVGILKNLKGKDADIIGAKHVADWAFKNEQ